MQEFEQRFTEMIQRMAALQGMDELTGHIFALLYLEPKEIAMDDLAKNTGYSLASISNKIKFLESAGLIKKSKKPGSKKIYLSMEKDMLKIMRKGIEKKQKFVINTVKTEVPDILKQAKPKSDLDKKKLTIIQNYYDHVMKFEKILEIMFVEMEKLK